MVRKIKSRALYKKSRIAGPNSAREVLTELGRYSRSIVKANQWE